MSSCRLIATFPSFSNLGKIEQMLRSDVLYGARFNSGAFNSHSALETVATLKELSRQYGKRLWIDLKGRQLRVTRWSAPEYQCIEVNHRFTVSLPAKLLLRGEEPLDIVEVSGNRIIVDPLPRHAVGEGQAVNVLGGEPEIEGYLTDKDMEYLEACRQLDVRDVMISYAETPEDVAAVKTLLPDANIVCKIESEKGAAAAADFAAAGCTLMAARDDLYIETGFAPEILGTVRSFAQADPQAICASRIFASLEDRRRVQLADFSDLELMYSYGYRNFMLSDGVSINHFDEACDAWSRFARTHCD